MSEEPEVVAPEVAAEPEPTPEIDAPIATTLLVWRGVAITVPTEVDDLDPDAVEAIEDGKVIASVRGLLVDQYDSARVEFKKKHGRRPTMRDITELFELVIKHFGFESPGE